MSVPGRHEDRDHSLLGEVRDQLDLLIRELPDLMAKEVEGVRSSKNGVGRPSPRNHQPRSLDARRAKRLSEGGAGALGGKSNAAAPR
jgi:hypothetical protein